MSPAVDHVLLTRFNLHSPGVESLIRAKRGWLCQRVGLFERFCLPSVRAQKDRDFHWVIYFDPDSPQWLRDRITAQTRDGTYVPIFRATVSNDELISDIRSVIGSRGEYLITTNLDNDDAVAHDFTSRLRAVSTPYDRAAIYLTHGLIKHSDEVYFRRDRRNAFCSVRESWESPRTVWSEWHNLLGRTMPAVEVAGDPAWLQVIHGNNVSNRVRGRRVSPARYRSLFPGLLDDMGEPTRRELAEDLLVARPRRFIRESGRAAAKTVVMKTLGRDGLDRAKSAWEGIRDHA